jgi:hypothetical protein
VLSLLLPLLLAVLLLRGGRNVLRPGGQGGQRLAL